MTLWSEWLAGRLGELLWHSTFLLAAVSLAAASPPIPALPLKGRGIAYERNFIAAE